MAYIDPTNVPQALAALQALSPQPAPVPGPYRSPQARNPLLPLTGGVTPDMLAEYLVKKAARGAGEDRQYQGTPADPDALSLRQRAEKPFRDMQARRRTFSETTKPDMGPETRGYAAPMAAMGAATGQGPGGDLTRFRPPQEQRPSGMPDWMQRMIEGPDWGWDRAPETVRPDMGPETRDYAAPTAPGPTAPQAQPAVARSNQPPVQAIPAAVTARPSPRTQFQAPPDKPRQRSGNPLAALGQPESSQDLWTRVKAMMSQDSSAQGGMAPDDKKNLGMALLQGGLQALAASGQPGVTPLSALGVGGSGALSALQRLDATDAARAGKAFDRRMDMAKLYTTLSGDQAKLTQAAEQKRLDRESRADIARQNAEARREIAAIAAGGKQTQAGRLNEAVLDYVAKRAAAHDPLSGQPFDAEAARREALQVLGVGGDPTQGQPGARPAPDQAAQTKVTKAGQSLQVGPNGGVVAPPAPADPGQLKEGWIYMRGDRPAIWTGQSWKEIGG